MSLLPEFNEKFKNIVASNITESDMWKGNTFNPTFRIMKDILNTDTNPLTFEEVKAWFDRKATEGECVYHGICPDDSHRYEIFLANHYFIHQDGYARQRLAENRMPFSNLLNELPNNPLYTFCQMKGYVD